MEEAFYVLTGLLTFSCVFTIIANRYRYYKVTFVIAILWAISGVILLADEITLAANARGLKI